MSAFRAAVLDAWLGDRARTFARAWHSAGRRLRRGKRRIRYYHRVDDPRSFLLASVLGRFVDAYDLDLTIEIVPEPAAEVDPEPGLRAALDVEDTRRLAAYVGATFPEPGSESVAARVRMANAIVLSLAKRPAREQLDLLVKVSSLLLSRSGDALATMADEGSLPGQEVRLALEAAYARLRARGYFNGAAIEYEGEFYPGIERLAHLERRLVAEGLSDRAVAPRFVDPPAPPRDARTPLEPVDVEVFFSFRSPYSYIGLERIATLAEAHGIRIVLRPLMPMVMRGLAVPADKRRYIVTDAKREATHHGLEFGRIVDPVGLGVERCLAVVHAAASRGPSGSALAFARAALHAIWAEGVDMTTPVGLESVAARAGLDAAFVAQALADESFRDAAESNREVMYEAGSWGVPTFRVGGLVTWGQDRLPLVLEAVRAARGS